MNKIVKTVLVLVAGTVLTAGTAMAAPRHLGHCRPAPVHHRCPPPRPHVVHHVHHHGGEAAGWVALGAAAIGAVVGGLIGAAAN